MSDGLNKNVSSIPLDMLDQVLSHRGLTRELAAPALAYDGPNVLIDEAHPAWTGKPQPALSPDQQKIVKRLNVCRKCENFGGESAFNGVTLHCKQKGENAGCVRCRASLLSDSTDEGCPMGRWLAGEPIHVHNTATGLGDAVSGLYAVCGLADATGRKVIYHAHSAAWLQRASHPNVVVLPVEHGIQGSDLNGGDTGYNHSIRHAATRTQAYCNNVAKALGVPSFKPRRPANIDRDVWGERQGGRYVVFSPFSAYSSREWPAENWRQLADATIDKGVSVRCIGSVGQFDRMRYLFGSTRASWLCGAPPAEVTDLLIGAQCVIGNDSGIVHVAGLLDVPAVAVRAACLPHDYLYDLAPSVRSVVGGGAERSDHDPQGLSSIPMDAVLAAITSR